MRDSRDEFREGDTKLPVHGFVLAGGKSLRMGQDKALLPFCGRPMVEIAVEKLREFCVDVSIAGNREDLAGYAPVVQETWKGAGPAAGIEAGLRASRQEWALFIPVDVPLVPGALLRRWAEKVFALNDGSEEAILLGDVQGSYLRSGDRHQPTFCMLRRRVLPVITNELNRDERRVEEILSGIRGEFGAASLIETDASHFAPETNPAALDLEFWFSNVNTPQELAEAEIWAQHRTA